MAGDNPGEGHSAGLLNSIKTLAGTLLAIVHTRLELVSNEVEAEWERLQVFVVLTMVSLFCLGFGVLLLTLFVVIVFWDSHRLSVLGGITAAYLGLGLAAAGMLRHKIRTRPRLFATTLGELRQDRDLMTPRQ